jgi:GR25 family glycosyltransferase involved in LPS biosynthesis
MKNKESLVRHLKLVENKTNVKQIGNIDYIYLINLDKRPEKLENCRQQLALYDIHPHRFPAIYGWDLSQDAFDDIAMEILPGMTFDRPVHFRPVAGGVRGYLMNPAVIGRHCVHHTMAAGALGCALSHLSILVDALRSGYQTIWILEDDITVKENPVVLADLIDQLHHSAKDWDVLYTDNDDHFVSETVRTHMGGGNWGRPGIPMTSDLVKYCAVGSEFYQIGGRTQTHSMIIRRSGVEKILGYLLTEGIFRPYDLELAFIPGLKIYNLARDVVHGRDRTLSDTFYKNP